MVKFFRTIRKKLAAENKIPAYFRYAIGEIILVVIGILIALQINNWNQKRIENNVLWGYLNNISVNIQNDLDQASDLNFVLDQLANNTPRFWRLRSKPHFTLTDYKNTQDHINTLFGLQTFEPNTSGFETLKTTGYMGKLQNTDMETLLFFYYDLAKQIKDQRENDKAFLTDILMENNKTDWGFSYEEMYLAERDSTVFMEIKDKYQKMINAPTYDAAVVNHSFNYFLPSKLELNFIGKSIMSLIETQQLQASRQTMRSVMLYKTDFTDVGKEAVVMNGIVPKSIAVFTNSNNGFDQLKFEGNEDYLEFTIQPDLQWAAGMFVVDSLGRNLRASKDFRDFKKISVELKGDKGGEKLQLALKDKFDPDDGTESRADITLSTKWQTYTFDLRKNFPTANLKNLHQLAGFVVQDLKGMTFYVRNIQFLKD
ncbi:hypothetical protein C7S20_08940 [Christiangramia fulva]|uniref:Uncharacterized protein n=1 Tax=Christiangramia fulva TaxID=2126553 RepID=A0A2R3Z544_9FLAO|nr:DUF6090 family protein [Christiangramia fulva]AVR45385.1 hypothetical protein C7S20_08940 [Christiangramia fulva]